MDKTKKITFGQICWSLIFLATAGAILAEARWPGSITRHFENRPVAIGVVAGAWILIICSIIGLIQKIKKLFHEPYVDRAATLSTLPPQIQTPLPNLIDPRCQGVWHLPS